MTLKTLKDEASFKLDSHKQKIRKEGYQDLINYSIAKTLGAKDTENYELYKDKVQSQRNMKNQKGKKWN